MILILCPILFLLVSIYAGRILFPATWESRCVLLRQTKDISKKEDFPQLFNPVDINTIISIIQTRDAKAKVIKELKLSKSVDELTGNLSVSNPKNSEIIIISYKDRVPQTASEIANAFVDVFFESYSSLLNKSAMDVIDYYKAYSIKIENEIHPLENKLKSYQAAITIGKEIADKQNQLSQLTMKYTDKNPKVLLLNEDIESLKKQQNEILSGIPKGSGREQPKLPDDGHQKADRNSANIESIYADIKREIDLKRGLLGNIDQIVYASKIATESKLGDISVIERAVPPSFHMPTKKKILTIAGGVLGILFALFIIIVPELLSFTFKSDREMKNVLKIKTLGMLPDKEGVPPPVFYSAFQIFFGGMVAPANIPDPVIIAFCGLKGAGKSFIIDQLFNIVNERKAKVLFIDMTLTAFDKNIENSYINKYLYDYQVDASSVIPNKISDSLHKLYFHLDEVAYRHPIDKERLNSFACSLKKNYDYIFCELFSFADNKELFSVFTELSDLALIISKFRYSNKFADKVMIDFIRERNTKNIAGVLNYVDSRTYRFLT